MLHKRETESIAQFDEWAATYERGFWSGYFNSVYETILSCAANYLRSDSTVLDIGCGTGMLDYLLSDKIPNGKLLGLDISPRMIQEAEKKRLARFRNVSFVVSKATSLPCAGESFDMVFSLNSLHHLPNHQLFFIEVSRVLKQGGVFILLDLVNDNLVRRIWAETTKVIFKERDVEFHSREEIRNLCSQASLQIESQQVFWYFTAITVMKKMLDRYDRDPSTSSG